MCVRERERERERRSHYSTSAILIAACVCVCVFARVRDREGHITVESAVLIAACLQPHHFFCHATLLPSLAWTDDKTKDIINGLYFYFESWISWLWKGVVHFRRVLVVFGQSQCTVSAGQSEQTVLVGRRDFVENKSKWERRGIEDLQ